MNKGLITFILVALLVTGCSMPDFFGSQDLDVVMSEAVNVSNESMRETEVFKSGVENIYVSLNVKSSWKGKKVGSTWEYLDFINGLGEKEVIKVGESELVVKDGDRVSFSVSRPRGAWPEGNYRVTLSVLGEEVESVGFIVVK